MLTLLVVEPHDDTREMLAEFFRYEGLNVLTAAAPHEARPLAHCAGIVITALKFGSGFAGIDFVRALRREHQAQAIIAYTTCNLPGVERDARAAGCDAFFLKPCAPDALLDGIRALERRRQALAILPARRSA